MFLTRYLTRPNARVQRELARIKTEMNWATGVPRVGVHIRHGDTVHMQFPVWAYADAAKRIARAHGASELYFTSDDEKVRFLVYFGCSISIASLTEELATVLVCSCLDRSLVMSWRVLVLGVSRPDGVDAIAYHTKQMSISLSCARALPLSLFGSLDVI